MKKYFWVLSITMLIADLCIASSYVKLKCYEKYTIGSGESKIFTTGQQAWESLDAIWIPHYFNCLDQARNDSWASGVQQFITGGCNNCPEFGEAPLCVSTLIIRQYNAKVHPTQYRMCFEKKAYYFCGENNDPGCFCYGTDQDSDEDGIPNECDNCPNYINPDQEPCARVYLEQINSIDKEFGIDDRDCQINRNQNFIGNTN